ncbi:DUF1697 domain-containing protein [Streptomyces palmae]|uniref:DUF1697 domain-containing protein n=1 Tax=Streptomyces palmae TaxID=1701085 RepID=A0A4Z0GJH6_9ACTN|nr:DUF1697 domain-containing protein [Streptomyces palmae]TGA96789.1 DUF1697 domain-containing protein [Streptomyces palmae]
MATQIALLRGINVGGHNKFTVAQQRELMHSLGYRDITVHLHSGNIVFADPGTAPAESARRIEDAIADRLGLTVPVMVRTRDELAATVAANPYPEAIAEPKTLHVVFLADPPADTAPLAALDPSRYAPDRCRLIGREIFLHCPDGLRGSKLATKVTGIRLGVTITARNWNTVSKLLALAERA